MSSKRVINIGRWRIAVMYGSRYRLGGRVKRIAGRPVGFDAGLGVCVVSGIRRGGRR